MDDTISPLLKAIDASSAPDDLKEKVRTRLNQLERLHDSPMFMGEVDRMNRYIDWIIKLPWQRRTEDNLDLENAKKILEKGHYGLKDLKDRVLEYMSVMKLLKEREGYITRAPILCFVGLVGTGKTTFAYSIAEALGREIARIPFGGMGDPLDLRGLSRTHSEAEPGKIIKALVAANSRNPVILLDEIDRVTDEGRASIMGVLVELLDPKQNHAFTDHYIDYPVNLSESIFVATANNTTNIATAVMDRLEPIVMPSYTDEDKMQIAKAYIMPKALEEGGIPKEKLIISEDVWPMMVRPLGYDAGIRTLERTLQGVVRKAARLIVEQNAAQVVVTNENVKQFLPHW